MRRRRVAKASDEALGKVEREAGPRTEGLDLVQEALKGVEGRSEKSQVVCVGAARGGSEQHARSQTAAVRLLAAEKQPGR